MYGGRCSRVVYQPFLITSTIRDNSADPLCSVSLRSSPPPVSLNDGALIEQAGYLTKFFLDRRSGTYRAEANVAASPAYRHQVWKNPQCTQLGITSTRRAIILRMHPEYFRVSLATAGQPALYAKKNAPNPRSDGKIRNAHNWGPTHDRRAFTIDFRPPTEEPAKRGVLSVR